MVFPDVHTALAYMRFKNPARARYPNLLEEERGSYNVVDHFTGDHPDDIWCSIVGAIAEVSKYFSDDERIIFTLCETAEKRLNVEEVAEKLYLSYSTARKMLYRTKDALERELMRRELVEFKD